MTNTTNSHEIITQEYEKCPWLDEVRLGGAGRIDKESSE